MIVTGSLPHLEQVIQFTHFLRILIHPLAERGIKLKQEHIDRLWACLVNTCVTKHELVQGLDFFSEFVDIAHDVFEVPRIFMECSQHFRSGKRCKKSLVALGQQEIFCSAFHSWNVVLSHSFPTWSNMSQDVPAACKSILLTKLPKLDASTLPPQGFVTFIKYFYMANIHDSKMVDISGKYLIDNMALLGMDTFWNIALHSPDEVEADALQKLNLLFNCLTPQLQMSKNKLVEDHLRTIMGYLAEAQRANSERTMLRSLKILEVSTVSLWKYTRNIWVEKNKKVIFLLVFFKPNVACSSMNFNQLIRVKRFVEFAVVTK